MRIFYHPVIAFALYGGYFIWIGQPINLTLMFFTMLGAALVDLDYLFVIATQNTPFTNDVRSKFRKGDIRGVTTLLMSKERKNIGKMHFHNFYSLAAVIAFSIMTLPWVPEYTKALLLWGVIPHLLLDIADAFIVIRSLRNWFWERDEPRAETSLDDWTKEKDILDNLAESYLEFRKLFARYVYHLTSSSPTPTHQF